MIWTSDPLRDFDRWSEEQEEAMRRFPICYGCGDRITEGPVRIVYWGHKEHLFCEGCVEEAPLSDYITDVNWGIA